MVSRRIVNETNIEEALDIWTKKTYLEDPSVDDDNKTFEYYHLGDYIRAVLIDYNHKPGPVTEDQATGVNSPDRVVCNTKTSDKTSNIKNRILGPRVNSTNPDNKMNSNENISLKEILLMRTSPRVLIDREKRKSEIENSDPIKKGKLDNDRLNKQSKIPDFDKSCPVSFDRGKLLKSFGGLGKSCPNIRNNIEMNQNQTVKDRVLPRISDSVKKQVSEGIGKKSNGAKVIFNSESEFLKLKRLGVEVTNITRKDRISVKPSGSRENVLNPSCTPPVSCSKNLFPVNVEKNSIVTDKNVHSIDKCSDNSLLDTEKKKSPSMAGNSSLKIKETVKGNGIKRKSSQSTHNSPVKEVMTENNLIPEGQVVAKSIKVLLPKRRTTASSDDENDKKSSSKKEVVKSSVKQKSHHPSVEKKLPLASQVVEKSLKKLSTDKNASRVGKNSLVKLSTEKKVVYKTSQLSSTEKNVSAVKKSCHSLDEKNATEATKASVERNMLNDSKSKHKMEHHETIKIHKVDSNGKHRQLKISIGKNRILPDLLEQLTSESNIVEKDNNKCSETMRIENNKDRDIEKPVSVIDNIEYDLARLVGDDISSDNGVDTTSKINCNNSKKSVNTSDKFIKTPVTDEKDNSSVVKDASECDKIISTTADNEVTPPVVNSFTQPNDIVMPKVEINDVLVSVKGQKFYLMPVNSSLEINKLNVVNGIVGAVNTKSVNKRQEFELVPVENHKIKPQNDKNNNNIANVESLNPAVIDLTGDDILPDIKKSEHIRFGMKKEKPVQLEDICDLTLEEEEFKVNVHNLCQFMTAVKKEEVGEDDDVIYIDDVDTKKCTKTKWENLNKYFNDLADVYSFFSLATSTKTFFDKFSHIISKTESEKLDQIFLKDLPDQVESHIDKGIKIITKIKLMWNDVDWNTECINDKIIKPLYDVIVLKKPFITLGEIQNFIVQFINSEGRQKLLDIFRIVDLSRTAAEENENSIRSTFIRDLSLNPNNSLMDNVGESCSFSPDCRKQAPHVGFVSYNPPYPLINYDQQRSVSDEILSNQMRYPFNCHQPLQSLLSQSPSVSYRAQSSTVMTNMQSGSVWNSMNQFEQNGRITVDKTTAPVQSHSVSSSYQSPPFQACHHPYPSQSLLPPPPPPPPPPPFQSAVLPPPYPAAGLPELPAVEKSIPDVSRMNINSTEVQNQHGIVYQHHLNHADRRYNKTNEVPSQKSTPKRPRKTVSQPEINSSNELSFSHDRNESSTLPGRLPPSYHSSSSSPGRADRRNYFQTVRGSREGNKVNQYSAIARETVSRETERLPSNPRRQAQSGSFPCEVCSNPATLMCSNCCSTAYCSETCATKDWTNEHYTLCRKIQDAACKYR